MALLDADSRIAVIGESVGYWLDSADYVFGGEDHEEDVILEVGPHTFPRDWPDVYEESDALRKLLRRKGPCAAKRVSVVPEPEEEHLAWVDGLEVRHLQSRANAEAARDKADLEVVEGWAVYDLLDDVTGAAFVAERYWWNSTEDGTWVDYTPRPENMQQLLLVEALVPFRAREAVRLTSEHKALADHLLRLRFPKASRGPARAVRLVAPTVVCNIGVSGGSAPSSQLAASDDQLGSSEAAAAFASAPAAVAVAEEIVAVAEEIATPTALQDTITAETSPEPDQPAVHTASVAQPGTASSAPETSTALSAPETSTATSAPETSTATSAPQTGAVTAPQAGAATAVRHTPPTVPSMSAEDAKARVKRVRMGQTDELLESLRQAEASAEACDRLVMAGMSGALVCQLRGSSSWPALRLLGGLARMSLTMAAPGGGLYRRVSESVIAADGMPPLAELLTSKDMKTAALAAESIGHLCFRNPIAQVRAVRAGVVRALVRLLGRRREGGVKDVAYALWNLQVGQKEHSQLAFREGAAAVLLPLFTAASPPADDAAEALVNVLGALTSLLLSEGAQDALGANGAVEALCTYLGDNQPTRVREQAAAALANLLSSHGDNCRKALYRASALQPLLALMRLPADSPSSCAAAENAAASLGNIIASTGPRAAQNAVDEGALEASSALLQSNVRPAKIFALLANLSWHLPELCPKIYQAIPMQRLVDILRPGEGEQPPPRARLGALALCANLASHGPAKTRLLRCGILPPVINMLESSLDKALKEYAATTLANLLEDHPESVAKVFLDVPNLPRRLVYILDSKKDLQKDTRQQLVRAVALLASREASRVSLKEGGAAQALTNLLDDAVTARDAAMGLLNLAPVARNRDTVVKKGVVKKLVQLLKQPDVQSYAAGALANITAGCKTAASQAASEGAVSLLSALLLDACAARGEDAGQLEVVGHADNDVAAWALGAIAHILDIVDTTVVRLEAGSALPSMCQLLREGQGFVQELAIFALGALAKGGASELRTVLRAEGGLAPALQQASKTLPDGPLKERATMLLRLTS